MTAVREPVAGAPVSARSALTVVASCGLGVALAYACLYPWLDVAFPFGWDSPVYIWWARLAGSVGVSAPEIAARPASIGLVAGVAAVIHVQTAVVVSAVVAVLVATTSLAAGAVVNAWLGADRLRFAITVAMVSGSLWFLAAGYLSTLAFATCFLTALALLARPTVDVRGACVAGVVLGIGGAAHPLFMLWGACVLLPAAALVWAAQGRGTGGIPTVVALGVGSVITIAALAATGGTHAGALEYSRDGMLKTTGLASLSIPFHQEKLLVALPFLAISGASALLALSRARRARAWWRGDRTQPGLLVPSVLIVWIAGTVLSAIALAAALPAPAQRLAIFCLPLPMLAAIGAADILRPRHADAGARAAGIPRLAAVAAAMMVVGFAVALGFQGWRVEANGSIPSHRSQLVERAAAAATSLTPVGTPVVIVVDGPDDRGIAKAETLIRTELPPDRIGDVYFFVGSPADLLARRVRTTGPLERDRIAHRHLAAVRPVLGMHPLVLAIARDRRPLHGWESLGGRLFQLRDATTRAVDGRAMPLAEAAQPPINPPPYLPLVLAPLLLLGFGLLGLPFARSWVQGDRVVAFALAPAAGIALVATASVAISVLGVRLDSAAGRMLLIALPAGVALFRAAWGYRPANQSAPARGPATV